MPLILERLVRQLINKGKSPKAARAIAVSSLQRSGNLKKGTSEATHKGRRRGAMTPGQRAIDRASKRSGRKITDYKYNAATNRATLKRTVKNRGKKT
jgi:hypothetical protein